MATGFTLCFDLTEMVGKSVVERRKVLKQKAREQQATLNYWLYHSSDEFVVQYMRDYRKDGRTAGERKFDRVCCLLTTIPDRHKLLDEIEGTDKARDRWDKVWDHIHQ